MSEIKGKGFDALSGFKASKPVGPSRGSTTAAEEKVTAPQRPVSFRSIEVQHADRAGRAPYNFVPLPEVAAAYDDPVPSASSYAKNLLSGVIELKMQSLTPFYVRGMWDLEKYRKQNKKIKDQTEPFWTHDRLRLPGSSIRGMVRTLVEILGLCPLEPINSQQLFFRAVGASPNPEDGSFEPQAMTYKERIGGAIRGGGPLARPGNLYRSAERWEIRPLTDASLFRVGAPGFGAPKLLRIDPKSKVKRYAYGYDRIRFQRPDEGDDLVTKWKLVDDPDAGELPEEGWIICSGSMPGPRRRDGSPGGKQRQWIIGFEESGEVIPLDVDEEVRQYCDSGVTNWMDTDADGREFDFRRAPSPAPCFFVQWGDGVSIAFGHTPNFRLPYKTRTGDANPLGRTKNKTYLDTAIFGDTGRRGRVAFEDAVLVGETNGTVETDIQSVVLGSPKPTTYQHYLVQDSEDVEDAIHWDGGENARAVLRGHKLYWHRPGATFPEPVTNKAASKFRRAASRLVFRGRIRYDNLRPVELGALLMALDLPIGCAHRLGMGKPLGLGSFRTSIKVWKICRELRYSALLETGLSDASTETDTWKKAFADWYHEQQPAEKRCPEFWAYPRLRDLKDLLTSENLPREWEHITRYLGWTTLGQRYNEYQEVWYKPNRRPRPSKRRPLPPAAQVRAAFPAIPADPNPFGPQPVARPEDPTPRN